MTDNSSIELPVQICVVGDSLFQDRQFVQLCQSFGHPVIFSSTGEEHIYTNDLATVYVVGEFCGPAYDRLAETKQHILGPPAVKDLATENRPILLEKRPIFCLALAECYIIFTGYRKKADLERLLKLIHTMGGSVGKEVGVKMTHLIATTSMGDKYQYATTFSVPVLTEQWLHAAWDNRHTPGYRAKDKEQYQQYKVKPFMGNTVCFYGFDSLEEAHMKEVLVSNGGKVAGSEGVADPATTHLVVDENNIEVLPPEVALNHNCVVVKAGWFWDSIQIEAAADVKKYVWREGGNGILSPNRSVFSPPTPSSAPGPYSGRRKRKHREEMIRRLASVDTPSGAPSLKRRSSVSEAYLLSTSGSFLDKTDPTVLSPEKVELEPVTPTRDRAGSDETLHIPKSSFDVVTATARRQVFQELVTTESNYVDILACICGIWKEAGDSNQRGGAVLDEHDLNIIFADVEPIFNLHVKMLKKLKETELNWKEDVSVGQVIVKFADDMLKAYPPFVNFFERTRTQIEKCDKNMRFHALLKNWERKPESSRQPLKELMIRPVQRLPSLSLLLTDLLKHTLREKDHPDAPELEKALARIKEVMSNMNEEKRKTEGQITLFDIYNEIQDCPASIVNSHRSFICRNEVIEVAADDAFCGKGYELTLFLFTDILVVAKKKSGGKGMGMIRSPSTASISGVKSGHSQPVQAKTLKFVKQIPLNAVKRLVEVAEDEGEVGDIVALVCRLNEDLKEKCYTLQILIENPDDRTTFLKTICRHVANTLCRPDPESLLVKMSARELSFDPGDLNVSAFSRAFSSFLRNKQKVGRKFSFNKTPNKLRRAVSTMLSPSGTLPLGYHSTPSDSMRDLRLEKEQRRTEKLRREQDEDTQEAFDVRAEEYIDESENIKTQFQRFASLLIETTKCEKIPTLSDKEIDLLKKNWHIVIVNLLPFEADKIIKMIENISFHRNGIVNENESVSTMFKIFSSYVKMELISLEEVSEAFNCIGIYIFVNFSVSLVKKISSEAILRIHFPEKGIFFNSDSSSQAFCKHLQKEVVSSLSSQVALKWVKEKLKDDEDIIGLENYSFFDEFPFHKVDINVSYAYPGSTNCIVNIIFPEILENPQETNALIKIIETVLKKIKFLSKSNFTVDDQIETDHNILRLKLDVDIKKKKWNWWKRKDDLKSFLDGFVDDVRKNIISSEEEMMNILMENEHMTPGASQLLVSKLLKKDKFLIDIKTEKDLSVDTVRFKNIPVWPLKSRKLSELPIQTRIDIQNMMKNNFPKEICEEVAENLDVFRQDNNFDNLFESLNNIPTYLSPYIQIIKSYSEKQGTIDGLQSMLHYCLESTTIRKSINDFGKNPDEVINDMICQIDLQNERFFNEWWNTIKSRTNILENTCIANYQDFKKACMSKNTMAVLKDNVRNWDRHMKSIVQEGDQIWMWRDKFKKGLQYAHVGVYVGGGDMIHVSAAGLNGIITKEKAVDVIKDSKCFIVRPDPSRLRPEAGTPKRRAEACLGLTFLYSVTEGSCEVFVNCVTLGIWTTDCATLQGRDHPHVDNTLTAVNAVFNLRTRQTQRKDLLDQLAARLLENGFNDANCNQHARVRDIITPSMQQQASRENVQNAENVREPEDLEQSTESSSEIGENTTLGHNAETTSYTPNQQASSLHTSEDDADTNIRVSDSEVLKESSKIGQDTATGYHTETTSSTPNQQGSPVKMHQDDDTSEIGPNRNGTSLGQFLADIGLSQLQDAIEQEDVDFNMLVTSTNEELKDMGISKFGHRRKILDAARKIKGETMSLPSPNHSTTKMPEIIFDEEVPILPSLGDSRTQGVNKASTSKESYS